MGRLLRGWWIFLWFMGSRHMDFSSMKFEGIVVPQDVSLPRPGIESVSPVLIGRFLTTGLLRDVLSSFQ